MAKITFAYQVGSQIKGYVETPFDETDKILELGCGDNPLFTGNPNWVTADYRKTDKVNLVVDLEKYPWPIENDSFSGIYGAFVIEHIAWRHTVDFLKECFRILKPGGHIMMIGPNTLEQCKLIVQRGYIGVEESALIFGGQDDGGWNAHKAAFSHDFIINQFAEAGFKEIVVKPWIGAFTDMETTAEKPLVVLGPGTDTKLNIGSFTVMFKDGWINADVLDLTAYAQKEGYLFRQFDATKNIPYMDKSVSLIVASHFLEHISRADGEKFLKECRRVLKPDGIIRLTIPDTYEIARHYADDEMVRKPISVAFDFNEGVKNAEDECEAFWNLLTAGHVTAYDEPSLTDKMKKAGFDVFLSKFGESLSPIIKAETKDMYPELSLYLEGKVGRIPEEPYIEYLKGNIAEGKQ